MYTRTEGLLLGFKGYHTRVFGAWPNYSHMELAELFSGHGAVTPQFKVVQTDRNWRPRTEKAKEPSDEDNERIGDKTDTVAARSGRRRKREADPRESRTLFVGNLPSTVTRRKLKQLFSQHGKVVSVRLRSMVVEKGKLPVRVARRKQKQITSPTINAYVVFEEEEQAENALALNGASVSDRHIRVDLAGGDKDNVHGRSVFVGGLPYKADDEEVREVFAKFGDVESVRVVRERHTGTGKGFGFVTFADKSGSMFALQHGGDLKLSGQKLRVMKSKNLSQGRQTEVATRFSGLQAKNAVKTGTKMKKSALTGRTGQKKRIMKKFDGAHRFSKQVNSKTASGSGTVDLAGTKRDVRPSRTFHKKKEARKREREESVKTRRVGGRAKRDARPDNTLSHCVL